METGKFIYRISKDYALKLREEKIRKNEEKDAEVENMKEAREKGDLSENYDYHASKENIGKLTEQIDEIQKILDNSTVVPISYYKYKNLSTNEVFEVTLVDDIESDLFTEKEIIPISNSSGIAKQLAGHKKGDEIDIRDLRKGEESAVLYKVLILEHDPDYSENK